MTSVNKGALIIEQNMLYHITSLHKNCCEGSWMQGFTLETMPVALRGT